MHHEPRTEGTDQHEVLLAAADVLPERHLARVAHRLGEETVGLLAALVGAEVVDVLEVDGVDPLEGHELVDVDGRAGRRLDRPELGVGEGDVALALELVALDQLVPLDDALAAGAVELLADARAALLVQQVEGRLLRLRGDVESYRDGDEAEADRLRRDGTRCHGGLLGKQESAAPGVVSNGPVRARDGHWNGRQASILIRQRSVSCATATT